MSATFDIFGVVLPDRVKNFVPISWHAASEIILSSPVSAAAFDDHLSCAVSLCGLETSSAIQKSTKSVDPTRWARLCLLAAAATKSLSVFVIDTDESYLRLSHAAWHCGGDSTINPLYSALTGRLATLAKFIPKSCEAGRLSGASLYVSRAELESLLRVHFTSEAVVRREVHRLVVECAKHKYVPSFDDFLEQLRAIFPKLGKRRLLKYWKPPIIPERWSKRGPRTIEGRPPSWTQI